MQDVDGANKLSINVLYPHVSMLCCCLSPGSTGIDVITSLGTATLHGVSSAGIIIYEGRTLRTRSPRENRMAGRSKNGEIKRLARERIAVLFQRAEEFFPENPGWSDRCVGLARTIAMRQRVGLDWQYRRKICPHCYRFHVPGVTMRVRIRKGNVVITCFHCHRQSRFPTGRSHESV
jgi:ribonuclease P protein subunit RPR2